jgi:hypothetical protein
LLSRVNSSPKLPRLENITSRSTTIGLGRQWNAAVARLLEASQSGSAQDIHRATLAVELAFLYEGKLNKNG